MRKAVVLITALLALLVGASAPAVAGVHPDATWQETYFESFDGTKLHADVLLPKAMPADGKVPIILTVSPYTNHLAEATTVHDEPGPSPRFFDFLNASGALKQGYGHVIVDLRGFGGSAGCNDWGGPGERGDVKAAVEWVASQSWSNGKVALFGKSYDGWTGLMGLVEEPKGLAAVISMEPVYSGYLYGYSNRIRFTNSVLTPALFTAIDAFPGRTEDTPEYHLNGNTRVPACYAANIGLQQQEEETSDFWLERDLVRDIRNVKTQVPVFLTQGFLEDNTKPEKAFEFWNSLTHPGSRAWFGQFAHVRGYEKAGARFAVGRDAFVAEAMRFLDEHLKGITTEAPADPKVEVQDSDGKWRAESAFPPADTVSPTFSLRGGSYVDDNSTSTTGGGGIWTISQKLPHTVHLSGAGLARVTVANTVPRANLVLNVYDIGPDGKAMHVSRGAWMLDGRGVAEFETYGQDWVFKPGRRIGILVSSSNSDWYVHVPTRQTVQVDGGTWTAPFKTVRPAAYLSGGPSPRLESHRTSLRTVTPETIAAAETEFPLPGPLQ